VFLVFNNGGDTSVRMPDPARGAHWRRRLDSARDRMPDDPAGPVERIEAESVAAFVLCDLAGD
jgi:hypothetical protein